MAPAFSAIFINPKKKTIVPANGKATSITDDFAESNKPSAKSLNISVSPKKINLNSATTKAITKNAIQMIFNAISNCLCY